jgi:putative inorganic carbon (hco3(-)) transporter
MKRESIFRATTRFGILLFALSLPISHVPAQFAIGIAFLGWLGEGLVNKKWSIRWHPAFAPLMIYLAWNILSAALSERLGHSLGAVLDNEWPLFIMLMLFWTIDDELFLKKVLMVFLSSACIAAIYALWQVVGGVELYRHAPLDPMGSGLYRAVGFYSFYLTFAAMAMAAFFFSTTFSFEMRKWYYVALSVLSFLAVVGTFARSMWLSFAIGIPIFAFARSRRYGTIVVSLIFILVVGGMITVPTLRHRIGSILDAGQNETRLNLWKTAVKVGEANPILGVGEDNWDLVFDRYRVDGYYDTTVHPHNDYLTVLVSSGVPGLLAFLSTWAIILAVGLRSVRVMRSKTLRAVGWGGILSLVGLLVGGLFQNYYGTFINCLEWWFVAGLLMTAARLSVVPSKEEMTA